jgi:hypothetical protein
MIMALVLRVLWFVLAKNGELFVKTATHNDRASGYHPPAANASRYTGNTEKSFQYPDGFYKAKRTHAVAGSLQKPRNHLTWNAIALAHWGVCEWAGPWQTPPGRNPARNAPRTSHAIHYWIPTG